MHEICPIEFTLVDTQLYSSFWPWVTSDFNALNSMALFHTNKHCICMENHLIGYS